MPSSMTAVSPALDKLQYPSAIEMLFRLLAEGPETGWILLDPCS